MTDEERGRFLALKTIVLLQLSTSGGTGPIILEAIREHIDPHTKERHPADTYAGYDELLKEFESLIKRKTGG